MLRPIARKTQESADGNTRDRLFRPDAGSCIIDSWNRPLPDLAERWGIPKEIAIAVGAGDNMGGSVGVGVGNSGDAVISVGTSSIHRRQVPAAVYGVK